MFLFSFKTIRVLHTALALMLAIQLLPLHALANPEETKAEIADKNLIDAQRSIGAAITAANNVLLNTSPVRPLDKSCAERILELEAAQTALVECDSSKKNADTMCITSLSPHIKQGAALVGAFMPMLSMATSTGDACDSYNGTMKAVSMALTAYNGACGAAHAFCSSACSKVKAQLTAATSLCVPADAKANEAVTALTKVTAHCKDYKMSLVAAGLGLMSTLQQSSLAAQCKKLTAQNQTCEENPQQSKCPKKVDCTKQEFYNHTQCICARNPTQKGCAGAYVELPNDYQNAVAQGRASGGTSSVSAVAATGEVNLGGPNTAGDLSAKADSNLAGVGGVGGAGGASGGGGGGGSVGAGGSGKKASDGVTKGLNPNILGGFDGGGGGGGGSFGRSSDDSNSGSGAYGAYMPGAEKDPARNIAASVRESGPVTGSGGKSNFEKVRERYTEWMPQALGN